MGPDSLLGFSVALGAGLLIGLERERRKRQGPGREAAGIRSFTLAALAGALSQTLGQPALVALGAALVAVLVGVAYARSRSEDPGVTTELALFVTYLIGVLCAEAPLWGAGTAALVAALLAARTQLHRFATQWLSEAELHDGLLLAALALVLLPLTPAEPVAWLAGLRPRTVTLTAVLILALQAAGHVAARVAGARAGFALTGLFSGFVSSTATIASLGGRARAEPALRPACEAGAMLSTASTWLQAMALLAALAPELALRLAPAAAVGTLAAGGSGWWRARGAPSQGPAPAESPRGPLQVRAAALVAALLSVVTLVVGWAQHAWGDAGALLGSALAALADAHASVATLGALQAGDRIDGALALGGVLLAISVNSVSRSAVAWAAGGPAYGRRVAASLALSTGLAWAVAALSAPLRLS